MLVNTFCVPPPAIQQQKPSSRTKKIYSTKLKMCFFHSSKNLRNQIAAFVIWKNSCVVFCTPISTKICFLGCFSSFTWNYLDVWWNVIYTCHMWWYICHRCQCDDVWHTNTTYISHFSVHANSVPFVYLDVFSQTQFCFDEYLSFILTFVADYCDCLYGTFWRPSGTLCIDILVSASIAKC